MGSGAPRSFCRPNQVSDSPLILTCFDGMMGDEVIIGFDMLTGRLLKPVGNLAMERTPLGPGQHLISDLTNQVVLKDKLPLAGIVRA